MSISKSSRTERLVLVVLALVVGLGVALSTTAVAHARTLTVPSPTYPTIKAALDAAVRGDTIKVLSSYDSDAVGEPFPIEVLVKKVTIRCASGARIAVPHSRVGITVAADDVTIDGCLIESQQYDPRYLGDVGVVIDDANNVTLSNLIIRDLNAGIMIIEGANNRVYNNTIYNIGQPIPPSVDPGLGGIGIYLEGANNNTFWGNVVYNCGVGLKLYDSHHNTFSGDTFGDPDPTIDQDGEDKDNDGNPKDDEGNAFMGVYLEKSNYNEFNGEIPDLDVDVSWNYGEGFVLVDSHNNTIKGSTIVENGRAGIKLLGSDNNIIEGNIIENNSRLIGSINRIGVHNDNKAVQIIVAPGESVEFRADFTPPETTGSGMLSDLIQEKARVIERVDGLQEKLIALDDELLRLMQKYDSALGTLWQIKDELQRDIGPTNRELREKVLRLIDKLFEIEAEKWLIEWKKHGFNYDKVTFPEIKDEVNDTDVTYKADPIQAGTIEVEVSKVPQGKMVKLLWIYITDDLQTQTKEVDSIQGSGTLSWTCDLPTDPYNPGKYLPKLFRFQIAVDDTTSEPFDIACVPEFPFIQPIDDEKDWIRDDIVNMKQKVHKLYEFGVLSQPLRDELLQKLDGVIGILMDIDAELDDIDWKLNVADALTPTWKDIKDCFYPTTPVNPGPNGEELDSDAVLACLEPWEKKRFPPSTFAYTVDETTYTIYYPYYPGYVVDTTLLYPKLPSDQLSLMDAKLWVKDAMDEFENICLVEPQLQPTERQCEGSTDKINLIWEKLIKFNEELPPPPFHLNGENLVGKVDDHQVTKEQICGNTEVKIENGRVYCSNPKGSVTLEYPTYGGNKVTMTITPLVYRIAEALNQDEEAYELAIQRWGRPWQPTDIYFEQESLGGSTGNQICSNVIRNFHNALAENIGIELLPGSSDNIICNNLITNEELTGIERGPTYQPPGKLTIGIKLIGDQNKIVYNAFEYLNIGVVRGIPKDSPEYDEDVKHIQIFKKLALKRCTPVDPPGAPSVPECEKPKKVIVRELSEEWKIVEAEGKARFNRLSLNLFEKTGIGIDVRDAESNIIDENLFWKNVSGAIVLDRMESHNVLDIQIDFNDFIDGFSVVNMVSYLPIDATNNYFHGSPTKGDVDPSYEETKGPETVYGTFNCPDNFAYTRMAGKFPEIASKGVFVDGQLPPNTDKLPPGVILPLDKPRTCDEVLDNPGSSGVGPMVVPPNPAQDLDGDGLFEDVNGNGRLDFDDAVQLALHIDQVTDGDVSYFDFNGNGRLDFDDAVRLAFRVGGAAAAQALIEMFSALSVTNITTAYDGDAVRFVVEGTGVAQVKVEVFNLAGALIYNSGFVAGHELTWNLLSGEGLPVANGVYLYVVTVRGYNGEPLRSAVRKLVVLRSGMR